jgi:hypothetical protein
VAARHPDRFDERSRERQAAQVELFETLLAALDVAGDLAPSRDERTRQAQSLVGRPSAAL